MCVSRSFGASAGGLNLDNVTDVRGKMQTFVALKSDSSVVTWGSAVTSGTPGNVIDADLQLQTTLPDLKGLSFNDKAVASLNEGTVVAWGHAGP